jgi:hypothetical protein
MKVVGDRRSIRWFRPLKAVEPAKIQRILEAARMTGCPGNLQPWRADQRVGYPAEGPDAGGQRPREPFDSLFFSMRWGTALERDPAVVADLERERLIQAAAPLPGRDEEIVHRGRMFGDTDEG